MTLYKGTTQKGTISGAYNSTITLSDTISSGQSWFIKVEGADSTVFGAGKYALQINMGTAQLPVVSSPNAATPATGLGGFASPLESGDEGYVSSDDMSDSGTIITTNDYSKHDGGHGHKRRVDKRPDYRVAIA